MSDIPDATLTRRRKAAIVVQMLIADGGSLPLSSLPESLQETLTAELAALRLLDRATMDAVAAEFAGELDRIGMAAPGSRDAAITALADHLSPDLAQRLQAQRAAVRDGDHWPVLADLPVARLAQIMQAESVEIGAVALSKLPVTKAAEVLAKTPGDRARQITYAMSLTAAIAPAMVQRIGRALAQDYGSDRPVAFDKAPAQRLGAILMSTPQDTRDDLLNGLGAQDEDFASDLRWAIFTFKDIATRVKPADIANCLRAVDAPVLSTALAAALAGDAALAAAAEHILDNISQRMAAQMRDDARDRGAVKKTDGEAAMAAVSAAVRDLVDSGAITLRDMDAEGEA